VKSGSGAKGAAVAKLAKAAGKARAGKGAKSPERAGRILVTTDHEVIRQWAKARGAVPSAVAGTQRNGQLGVLRFDLPGYSGDRLVEVSWAEWFEAFDKRRLNFIYQERRPSGGRSTFFQLENPDQ
jgi:hypothetical protein